MLTAKQKNLLEFIRQRINIDGVAPSYEEMKQAVGLKSKSGIFRLISALEERGFIRRLARRARALEIIHPSYAKIISPSPFSSPARLEVTGVKIPLLGRIAAGPPLTALENVIDEITIPDAMVASQGEHFALEVQGESMKDAGILEGDWAVIRRSQNANNGQIVVALIHQQEEATLKQFYLHGDIITLKAANPDYSEMQYHAKEVSLQGCMVGLIRRY